MSNLQRGQPGALPSAIGGAGGKLSTGTAGAGQLEKKLLGSPDEVRPLKDDMGQISVFRVGGGVIGRGEMKPGWKWSLHVKPVAGTDLCEAKHCGYIESGSLCVRMDSGEELTFNQGDFFGIAPGHDAWVVGDKPCILLDFGGFEHYAKPRS